MSFNIIIPQRNMPKKSWTPSDIDPEDHNGMILVCDREGKAFGFIVYVNGKWTELSEINCNNPNYENEDLNDLMNDMLEEDKEIVFKSWIF